jgi:iron complex outermembrane recepter protein
MAGKHILLATSVLTALAVAPAMAQDQAATTEARQLQTIVVTAQRREQALQDVPVSVAAFNEEALERLNARTIADLTGQVPTLVLTPVAIGPGLAQVSLRGINSQDPEKSFDPAVGVFVDGIYLGTNAANLLDAFDLASIEVLRGPQGTLFGRNTTGGAINATRSRPTGEFGVKASLTLGTAERQDIRAVVNVPLVADKLALKVSGFRQKDDGLYENSVAGGPRGARDSTSASAALLFTPFDEFEALLTYDWVDDNSELAPYAPRYSNQSFPAPVTVLPGQPGVPAGTSAVQPPDRMCLVFNRCFAVGADPTIQSNGPHDYKWDLDALTLQMKARIPNFEVISITGHRKAPEVVRIDFDALPQTIFHAFREQDYEQFSQEVRLVSDFEGDFNFVAGAYFFESEYTLNSSNVFDGATLPALAVQFQSLAPLVAAGVGPFAALAGLPPAVRQGLAAQLNGQFSTLGQGYLVGGGNGTRHQARTWAIYTQGDWTFGERNQYVLTAGLRYTEDTKKIEQTIFGNLPGDFPLPVLGIPLLRRNPWNFDQGNVTGKPISDRGSAEESWDKFTPKLAFSWKLDDLRMLYASWTQGYNAGGFSGRAGTVLAATTPYQPEKVTAYEVGLKSEWFDRRLRANFAGFFTDYQDKQEEIIVPIPVNPFTSTQVQNVSAAEIWGIEGEFNWLVTDDITINASFGYLNAEYSEFRVPIDATLVSPWFSAAGAVPPVLVRADLSNLQLRRTPEWTAAIQPVYDRTFASGRLVAKLTARYTGDNYAEFWNDPRGLIKAHTLVDVSASWSFGGDDFDRFKVNAFVNNATDETGPNSFVRAAATRSDFSPTGQGFLALSGVKLPRVVGVELQVNF